MLREYKSKRDFKKTPEPPARRPKGRSRQGLKFVVQMHDATRLHYDFRLELGGVLLSWAVPKGPSLDPHVKRLAVHVEDHPLSYGDFEGVIPEGEYGGGEVVLWDAGTYVPETEDRALIEDRKAGEQAMAQGLKDGKLSFTLHGKKLHGSWTLVRTRIEKNWLLIKHRDEFADEKADLTKLTASVKSGLTVSDLREGRTEVGSEGPPFPRCRQDRSGGHRTGSYAGHGRHHGASR